MESLDAVVYERRLIQANSGEANSKSCAGRPRLRERLDSLFRTRPDLIRSRLKLPAGYVCPTIAS